MPPAVGPSPPYRLRSHSDVRKPLPPLPPYERYSSSDPTVTIDPNDPRRTIISSPIRPPPRPSNGPRGVYHIAQKTSAAASETTLVEKGGNVRKLGFKQRFKKQRTGSGKKPGVKREETFLLRKSTTLLKRTLPKPRIRENPEALHKKFPESRRTPIKQIIAATWFSSITLVCSVIFIYIVIATTNGKEVGSSWWIKHTDLIISIGAMATKSSFVSIMGVALYQHLWYNIAAADKDIERGRAKAGMTLKHIEAEHQASKLKISMLKSPLISKGWIIGCISFLFASALVPVLQFSADTQWRTDTESVVVPMFHSQMSSQLAVIEIANIHGSHGDNPPAVTGGIPEVLRGATMAVFGEDTDFRYVTQNVTGGAIFGPVEYPDIECSVTASPLGVFTPINLDEKPFHMVWSVRNSMLYNFTSQWINPLAVDYAYYPNGPETRSRKVHQADVIANMTSSQRERYFEQYNNPDRKEWIPGPNETWTDYYIFYNETERENRTKDLAYRELSVNVGLANLTHWVNFTCGVRTARGECYIPLSMSLGKMGDLRCQRESWVSLDDDPLEDLAQHRAPALYAYGEAFTDVFNGTVWLDDTATGRITGLFPSASALLDKRTGYLWMPEPEDLIPHMQRVLWNLPMTVNSQAGKRRPPLFMSIMQTEEHFKWWNSSAAMVPLTVLNNRQVLVIKVDMILLTVFICVTLTVSVLALSYVLMSENRILGRLCRDSLVHNLTIGGRYGPAIRGACMAGLEDVVKVAGDERLQCTVLVTAKPGFVGHLGMAEIDDKFNFGKSVQEEPHPGMWYGGLEGPLGEKTRLLGN